LNENEKMNEHENCHENDELEFMTTDDTLLILDRMRYTYIRLYVYVCIYMHVCKYVITYQCVMCMYICIYIDQYVFLNKYIQMIGMIRY
jgi:hypothetical protein